jgi:hypothetical protein
MSRSSQKTSSPQFSGEGGEEDAALLMASRYRGASMTWLTRSLRAQRDHRVEAARAAGRDDAEEHPDRG